MNILKPCPFCGSFDISNNKYYNNENFYQCRNCSCCGPNEKVGSEIQWNIRKYQRNDIKVKDGILLDVTPIDDYNNGD
jgi:hypothetical protein